MTFMKELLNEIDRNRELQEFYKAIPTGFIGASIIELNINAAKKAIEDNDVVAMLLCFNKLKGNK